MIARGMSHHTMPRFIVRQRHDRVACAAELERSRALKNLTLEMQ